MTFAYVNRLGSRAVSYPFSAIVGQEEMKQALMLAAVDPAIGGILVFGDRGTGKSTAVRGLAGLLPPIRAIAGCRFNCDPDRPSGSCPDCQARPASASTKVRRVPVPVIDLPLGASEDRVVGALDLEAALVHGRKSFEPGLLASAHRGFLYIDEVNLLEDHIVDLLLDVAASGINVVEREGLSVRHASRFVLVGSGNPEEGELRPQLLDRFGLSVEVTSPTDIAERIEVVRRRDAYDRDPHAFLDRFKSADGRLRTRIRRAQDLLEKVQCPDDALVFASRLCMKLGVDGLRGELTLLRVARAMAALGGRDEVAISDMVAAAPSALRHRLRRDPLDEAGSTVRIERALSEIREE
jgi:magnesium chelatase subunit I